MKVVTISCSPRVGGNSDLIINSVLDGIRNTHSDMVVDKFKLNNLDIKGCKGCYLCKRTGECVQKDDMQQIYSKMYEADLLVFASPIYMGYITGIGKNFIDRLFAFSRGHFDISLPVGKKFIVILTQGHDREDAYRVVVDNLMNIFNGLGMESKGKIIAAGLTSNVEDIRKEILEIAYNLGTRI